MDRATARRPLRPSAACPTALSLPGDANGRAARGDLVEPAGLLIDPARSAEPISASALPSTAARPTNSLERLFAASTGVSPRTSTRPRLSCRRDGVFGRLPADCCLSRSLDGSGGSAAGGGASAAGGGASAAGGGASAAGGGASATCGGASAICGGAGRPSESNASASTSACGVVIAILHVTSMRGTCAVGHDAAAATGAVAAAGAAAGSRASGRRSTSIWSSGRGRLPTSLFLPAADLKPLGGNLCAVLTTTASSITGSCFTGGPLASTAAVVMGASGAGIAGARLVKGLLRRQPMAAAPLPRRFSSGLLAFISCSPTGVSWTLRD